MATYRSRVNINRDPCLAMIIDFFRSSTICTPAIHNSNICRALVSIAGVIIRENGKKSSHIMSSVFNHPFVPSDPLSLIDRALF